MKKRKFKKSSLIVKSLENVGLTELNVNELQKTTGGMRWKHYRQSENVEDRRPLWWDMTNW